MKRRLLRGQSMVEVALVLPFLILVFMGIIDGAYYVYTYSEIENATRRASERASKTPPFNTSDANDKCAKLAEDDALKGTFLTSLTAADISFGYVNGGGRNVGDQIQVTVDYTGKFLTPIGQRFFGQALKIKFISRRTITDTDPPRNYNADCTPQT